MGRSAFRVLFYLKRNAPKKNGLVPVMCRITVNGKISQFSCKLDVEEKLWNAVSAECREEALLHKKPTGCWIKFVSASTRPIRKLWIGMVMCLPRKSETHSWVWDNVIRLCLPYSIGIIRTMPNK